MKSEKMQLVVSKAFEDFLSGLEKPMALNEMRVMKEPKYSMFRELIRDTSRYGDTVLSKIA